MVLDRRHLLRGAGALAATVVSACAPGRTGVPAAIRSATAAGPASAAASPSARLPGEVTHGPRTRLAVALTFHGQGDPALATALLTELERAAPGRRCSPSAPGWTRRPGWRGGSSTAATNWPTTPRTTWTWYGWRRPRRMPRSASARCG